jgi:hypothetical protein
MQAERAEMTNSNAETDENESEGAEELVGFHRLPCKKTLTAWANSKFQGWLARLERSSESSEKWTWEHKKSRFSAEQILAWFEFKDKKYHEANDSGSDAFNSDRQSFGCNTMFHKDPAFISIFRKPLAKVVMKRKTGETMKLKRYSNESMFMFLLNSSDILYILHILLQGIINRERNRNRKSPNRDRSKLLGRYPFRPVVYMAFQSAQRNTQPSSHRPGDRNWN